MSHCCSQLPHSLRVAQVCSGSGTSTQVSTGGGGGGGGVGSSIVDPTSLVASLVASAAELIRLDSSPFVAGGAGGGLLGGGVTGSGVVADADGVTEVEGGGVTGVGVEEVVVVLVEGTPVRALVSIALDAPWSEQAALARVTKETRETSFRMKVSAG